MLTLAQQKAVELFVSHYPSNKSFDEICCAIASEIWYGIEVCDEVSTIAGDVIVTLITEAAERMQDIYQEVFDDIFKIIKEYDYAGTRKEKGRL